MRRLLVVYVKPHLWLCGWRSVFNIILRCLFLKNLGAIDHLTDGQALPMSSTLHGWDLR